MTRKLLFVAAAITMTFAISPADADAQRCFDKYNQVITCGSSIAYPSGGFSAGAPSSTASANTTAASTTTAASAGTAETSQGLAFTGGESQVLGYVGAGLVGLGGLALIGARRRRDNDPLS